METDWTEMPLGYATDDLWDLMTDPEGEDIHHEIEKYFEEVFFDVFCLMAEDVWAGGDCDEIREEAGLEEGETSTCWEAYYESMPDTWEFNYDPIVTDNCPMDPSEECLLDDLGSHWMRVYIIALVVLQFFMLF